MGSSKSAIASDLKASEFRLVDEKSHQIVLSKPIQTVKSHLGTFQLLDFSEIQQTGSYFIGKSGTVLIIFFVGCAIYYLLGLAPEYTLN